MKTEANTGMISKILDDGGPLLIRENSKNDGYFKGVLFKAEACNNPDCQCRDVFIRAIDIDERKPPFNKIIIQRDLFSSEVHGEILDGVPTLQLKIDIDTGRLVADENQIIGVSEAELIKRIDREVKKRDLLAIFQNRWRIAKGENIDAYKEKDWSWWESGQMVSWREVFPNSFDLLINRDEKIFFIDDQYCVTPGCNCKEVSLTFLEAEDREVTILGMLSVDIVKWKIENSEPEKLTDRELRELLKEFKKQYPFIKNELFDRRQRIRKAMTEVLMYEPPPQSPFKQKKIGRNAPCPCGSGKKYKKCCLI